MQQTATATITVAQAPPDGNGEPEPTWWFEFIAWWNSLTNIQKAVVVAAPTILVATGAYVALRK